MNTPIQSWAALLGDGETFGQSADEADGALPRASDIPVLNDLSSGGSDDGHAMMQVVHDFAPGASLAFYTAFDSEQDFANGMLATNVANVQGTASDVVVGTLQGSTWQSSITPLGNPSGAPTAILTGGQGISVYQTPITGLHAASPADGGGVAAVAASIAPASFAPAPAELTGLASPVAGSIGTSTPDTTVGSGGSTATVSTSGSGLVFVNTYTANCSQQYINCIVAAEQTLESLWTNSVTFNITFDAQAAGTNGFLAHNSWPSCTTVTYAQLKSALPTSDALPSTDPTAPTLTGNIPFETTFPAMRIKNFLRCLRNKDSPRQFECTRLITVERVKATLRTIPGLGARVSSRLLETLKSQNEVDIPS